MNCFTPLRAPLLTTPPAVSSWRASPRFFSGGFDVAEVFRYDRKAMTDFFGRFVDLYERLLRLPKPVVAAINGHAFAGGAARDVLPNGSTLSPTRALEVGLATELAAPEAVLQRACEHARALAAKPPEAFGAIKRSILAASWPRSYRYRSGGA